MPTGDEVTGAEAGRVADGTIVDDKAVVASVDGASTIVEGDGSGVEDAVGVRVGVGVAVGGGTTSRRLVFSDKGAFTKASVSCGTR